MVKATVAMSKVNTVAKRTQKEEKIILQKRRPPGRSEDVRDPICRDSI
jgi:hypothetical protein